MKSILLSILPLTTAAAFGIQQRTVSLFGTSSSIRIIRNRFQPLHHHHQRTSSSLLPSSSPQHYNGTFLLHAGRQRRYLPLRMVGGESSSAFVGETKKNDVSLTLKKDPSQERNNMKILGVCGGIGSGKSTACQLMVDSLGCVARIDADKLAHVVYEPGSKALEEIASEFGKDILDDGHIDRKKLGAIVFSDAESMSKLEQIVWPHVFEKIQDRVNEITNDHESSSSSSSSTSSQQHNIIIVEAALLLETNWHDLLDGLWVIQSSHPVAIQRLVENRGLTEEEALVRIHAQETRRGIGGEENGRISDRLKKEMDRGVVTAVITNDGTLEELEHSLKEALVDSASWKK
eukprot:CAMPEP_0183714088 /NCGR_PEP_ID=MMETSP0737-20130205/8758_1 /TAXON_ID=385413 /ORGANISM="Thalassiosira miniscula, Strain CCMP1093" /LENGTH=346 /DNA_ID=CAMNT_0025942993 /DNA_START=39 /DNA_END=1079 /DNA_ORIENTATION=+